MRIANYMQRSAVVLTIILMSVAVQGQGRLPAAVPSTAGVVVGNHHRMIYNQHGTDLYKPASTVKIITSFLAIKRWGLNHRFATNFYHEASTGMLWVKGSGDPYLVAEEIRLLSKQLVARGMRKVNGIALDTSLFKANVILPGTSDSSNPYDAVPTALAVNFNTINVRRKRGKIVAASALTPVTPVIRSIAKKYRSRKIRVNTGPNPRTAERHFAEVLAAIMRQEGAQVGDRMINGIVPRHARLVYRHYNSKNLSESLRAMLKYSTNFIANQLVLVLAAEQYRKPAGVAEVRQYLREQTRRHFGWTHYTLEEGAGLSHANQLSPKQLMDVLNKFYPYRNLLPKVATGIYAKSGTLRGVSTLSGYMVKGHQWIPFALMLRKKYTKTKRNSMAKKIYQSF